MNSARPKAARTLALFFGIALLRRCTGHGLHLRYALRQIRRLFLNSKFRRRIGFRFSPALELSGGSNINLFIDFGCTRPGSRDERSWNFWESREGILDERVGQCEMELTDCLQALESPCQTVRKIPKKRVDELLKVVALVGAYRDQVVEHLVIAPGVNLLPQSSKAL